jgi:ATP-dependent Clp protease adapter protein ClpS
MPGKSVHKKPSIKQAHLTSAKEEPAVKSEQVETAHFEMNLSPIIDKRSYDNFIKIISLRIYTEFEKNLHESGVDHPELKLVSFALNKTPTDVDIRMANYVAVNARLVMERAFIDPYSYAEKHMPRVMRQAHEQGMGTLHECIENKVQHDIMMEIRSIAIMHMPEDERFRHINRLKEL